MKFELSNLEPLVKKRNRVGRGGKRGGTSGKGHKGQKARSGPGIRITFEGGQMPLHRRLPKCGFTNARFQVEVEAVNLDRIETVFTNGEIVNRESLISKGILKSKKSRSSYRLKILGTGDLTKKLIIEADAFSKSALKSIQSVGGEARVIKGA